MITRRSRCNHYQVYPALLYHLSMSCMLTFIDATEKHVGEPVDATKEKQNGADVPKHTV